jgi:hypothetical protein
MYAVQLPDVIPAAGQSGGPPLPADFRHIGGMGNLDPLQIFALCVRDPQQIEPTMQRMTQMTQNARKNK